MVPDHVSLRIRIFQLYPGFFTWVKRAGVLVR